MKHLMLDLETLGDQPGTIITSIGAVEFDPLTGETGDKFHRHISIQSSIEAGFTAGGRTITWWLGRDQNARDYFINGQEESISLHQALYEFQVFMKGLGIMKTTVWGMGARFDCGILAAAFAKLGLVIPWDTRNEICLRTLSILSPNIRKEADANREGVFHNAVDDCLHQIKWGSTLYKLFTKPCIL